MLGGSVGTGTGGPAASAGKLLLTGILRGIRAIRSIIIPIINPSFLISTSLNHLPDFPSVK
jgi:hypothetical protein